MNIIGLAGKVLGGLATPVLDYLKHRSDLKAARYQAELAMENAKGERQAKLISEGLAADASWEMEQIRNAGWKDDVGFYAFLAAIMSCFVPAAAPHTLEGFRVLGTTPIWFQVAAVAVLLAPFGIRTYRRQQYDTLGQAEK